MNALATLSSERMNWETPPWFVELVRAVAPIAFDPCTTAKNPVGAQLFYSPTPSGPGWLGPCGLSGAWPSEGLGFWNPMYGPFLSGLVRPSRKVWRTNKKTKEKTLLGVGTGWIEKAALHEGESLGLVPARTGSKWFRRLFSRSHVVCLWNPGRIAFVDPDTGIVGEQPAHDSAVFYSGPNAVRFFDVFEPHGIMLRGGRR